MMSYRPPLVKTNMFCLYFIFILPLSKSANITDAWQALSVAIWIPTGKSELKNAAVLTSLCSDNLLQQSADKIITTLHLYVHKS